MYNMFRWIKFSRVFHNLQPTNPAEKAANCRQITLRVLANILRNPQIQNTIIRENAKNSRFVLPQ